MKKTLIILLLIIAVSGFSTTYYIRTDGNDSNTGLANADSTAWLTINSAHAKVSDSDIIYVEAGTYVEAGAGAFGWYMGTPKDVDYIANGTVIVQGDAGATTAVIAMSGGTKNTTFTGFTFDTNSVSAYGVYIYSGAGGKTFTNCIFDTEGGTSAIYDDASVTNTYTGCTISGEMTGNCIWLRGTTATIDNCTISGFTASDKFIFNFDDATGGGTFTISNNTITSTVALSLFSVNTNGDFIFHDNTISGQTAFTYLLSTGAKTGTVVMYNEDYDINVNPTTGFIYAVSGSFTWYIHDNNFNMYHATNDEDVFVLRNQGQVIFDDNVVTTESELVSRHLIITSTGTGTGVPTIRNNTFNSKSLVQHIVEIGDEQSTDGDNDFDGFIYTGNEMYGAIYYDSTKTPSTHGFFSGYNINGTIANNYSNGCGFGYIVKSSGMTYTSGGVYNNISINNNITDIAIRGTQDVKVYNNTIIHNAGALDMGIEVLNNPTGGGDAANPDIRNNIIYSTSAFNAISIGDTVFTDGYTCDYNCIFSTAGTGFQAEADDTTYTSLATWQAKLTDAANSINENPKLADNYSLKGTSPCKNAGVILAAAYDDQIKYNATFPDPDLTQQTGNWNMGAFSSANGGSRRRRR